MPRKRKVSRPRWLDRESTGAFASSTVVAAGEGGGDGVAGVDVFGGGGGDLVAGVVSVGGGGGDIVAFVDDFGGGFGCA